MRAHPWRRWLGAHLRGLADTVDPGRVGVSEPGAEHRALDIGVDGDPADEPSPVGGPGKPELILGLNLTDAPGHWARLVRDAASRVGGDHPGAGPSGAPPVSGNDQQLRWRP